MVRTKFLLFINDPVCDIISLQLAMEMEGKSEEEDTGGKTEKELGRCLVSKKKKRQEFYS